MPVSEAIGLLSRRPSTAVYRRSINLLLQVSLLFILGVTGLWAYFSLNNTPAVNASAKVASRTVKAVAPGEQKPAASSKNTAPAASSAAPSAAIAAVPGCEPDSAYQPPAKLALAQPGLQQVVDTPSSYSVYGNTAAQVMSQIASCTPVRSTSGQPGSFAASTAYAINWQFDYSNVAGGLCTVQNVRVNLHINQVFPAWQAGSGATAGLASRWQSYISELHAYENGHVQLDETAAATVLSDLQNFPPTDCGSIVQAATAKANADLAAYDAANANYDTGNGYGLKEGVIL